MRFTAMFNTDNSQEDILSYRVEDQEAIPHIIGLTVCQQQPQGTSREQQTVLAFTQPKANLDGPTVLAGEKASFGLEILVGMPGLDMPELGALRKSVSQARKGTWPHCAAGDLVGSGRIATGRADVCSLEFGHNLWRWQSAARNRVRREDYQFAVENPESRGRN